jgi:hypothetical protein
LLKPDLLSELVVEPTVMALGTYAGENPHESEFELPAATTTITPFAVAVSMAFFTEFTTALPPRLALKIFFGYAVTPATQSKAAMNHEKLPEPLSERTLTACNFDFLATP